MNNSIINKKLIAVYGRVSTSNQEDQKTIEAQLLEVRKFANENGYEIVKEYLDEGWSGDILARPSLDKLRFDAKNKMWEAVLIYDPDRLGRRLEYQMIVESELKDRGIDTLYVTVPPVKNLNDKMMRSMRGVFAEYEKGKIAERFRLGKVSRVASGNILVSEAPYGYSYISNMGKRGSIEYIVGHYEINEEEAKNVRDIFSWVADEGLTLRGVVRRLQDLGIKPRKSKRGVWNTSTLSTLFRNQTYIGKAHWGASYAVVPDKPLKEQKYKKNQKTSRKIKPEDEWLQIKVPRLVEDDVFNRAGQRLKDNFALMGRNKKNDYLLAGKIFCTCGERRCGEGPQKGKHLYYRCNDRVNCFPLPRKCLEKGINARIADKAILQRIEQMIKSPELLKAQVERYLESQKNNTVGQYMTIDIGALKKEIEKLKIKEERYTNAYAGGAFDLDKLKSYLTPITNEIVLLEKKIVQAEIDQKPKIESNLPTEEQIENFAKASVEIFDTLSFESKKGIISKSLFKVYSNQKNMQVYGVLNLQEIYVSYFSNFNESEDTEITKNYVELQSSYRNRWPS